MVEVGILEQLRRQVAETSLMNGQKAEHSLKAEIQKHTFDITRVPAKDDGILFINGELVGSKGNIMAVTGKAKARKSVVATSIASACISGGTVLNIECRLKEGEKVVHIDTEQGYSDYYNSVIRILDSAGSDGVPDNFVSIHERAFDSAQRLKSLEVIFEMHRPAVCIIDGVRDMLADFNSNEETDKVMSMLLRLSLEYNALIVCVIHVTKSHGNMRGALGTALEDKSETVIYVEKYEDRPDASSVKGQYCRHRDFEPFDIVWDEFNLKYRAETVAPPKAGRPKKTEGTDISVHVANAMRMFVYPTMKYGQLVETIRKAYDVGESGAKAILRELGALNIVAKDEVTKLYYLANKC